MSPPPVSRSGVETAHEALERRLRELGRQEHRHASRLLHGVEVRGIDVGALGRLPGRLQDLGRR